MREKERITVPAVGGSSLLVIFAVLCLTMLALLSLSTAQAEKRLSDARAASVTAYYAADTQAQEVFARLRSAEQVPGVAENEGVYAYRCPISGNQTLQIEVEQIQGRWYVRRWQIVTAEASFDETIAVWDGGTP